MNISQGAVGQANKPLIPYLNSMQLARQNTLDLWLESHIYEPKSFF